MANAETCHMHTEYRVRAHGTILFGRALQDKVANALGPASRRSFGALLGAESSFDAIAMSEQATHPRSTA